MLCASATRLPILRPSPRPQVWAQIRPTSRSLCTAAVFRGRQLVDAARAAQLRFVQFSFVDLFGVQRAKLVPVARCQELAEDGAGFAGFAAHLDLSPTDGDLLAVPDPSTLTPLPWKPEVGWVACDLELEGEPLSHSPRDVLQRANAKLKAHSGLSLKTGVECEFFLLGAGGQPGASPPVSDVLDTAAKPCYDAQALMRRYELIARLSEYMEALGWGPYQADHEDANGQFEINWDFSDALVTADRHTFFKYMVRTLAESHGLRATFMPKPFASLTGSGCHVHASLHDAESGRNVCGGGPVAYHGLSTVATAFLGGVLANAPALAALSNPTVNSYKRLNARATASGATWSPTCASWAGNNRTALVRVPGGARRMEIRLADMAANPYLLPAAICAAGLDGLEGTAPPAPPPADLNMFSPHLPEVAAVVAASPALPQNLSDALKLLEANPAMRETLGSALVDSYCKLRREHWNQYCAQLTQWELQTYLDC